MSDQYGVKAILPTDDAHVLGVNSARTGGTDLLLDIWNGSTSAARVFSIQKDGYAWLPNGAAANPALAFTSDPDTGLFRKGANQLGLAVGGAELAYLDASGLSWGGGTQVASSTGLIRTSDTATITGAWTFQDGTILVSETGSVDVFLSIYRDAGQNAGVYLRDYATGNFRWLVHVNSEAETGSNAGSAFAINRYSDAGAYIDQPFFINRANGAITIANALTVSGAATLSGDVTVAGDVAIGSAAGGILDLKDTDTTPQEDGEWRFRAFGADLSFVRATAAGYATTENWILFNGASDTIILYKTGRFTGDLEIDGALDHDGSTVGFYGTTPIVKPTVTGSRGGNAALANLLTALENLGLITDSTT